MSLTTKSVILITVSAVVIVVPLFLLRINLIAIFFMAVIGELIIYFAWALSKSKKISDILEEQCDPELYLKKCNKSHMAYPDYNKAVAYLSLGDTNKAHEWLTFGEMPKKQTKFMKLTYHSALMSCYLEMGDVEKAGLQYENHIKDMRKGLLVPKIACIIDLLILEYHYKLNATPETSKYFLEQLRYLFSVNDKTLSKRQKLSVLYMAAEILEQNGDIEAAVQKYKKVAEEGNKLHIAVLARKKIEN
jgi:tetratricopeptide (TPR) repeat protein